MQTKTQPRTHSHPLYENEGMSPKKTALIVVTVIGCIAILWPKVFYPMMFGSPPPRPNAIKEPQRGGGPGGLRQERPAHLHPESIYQAMRERGRAIPATTTVPIVNRKGSPSNPPPRYVDGRPGPIPGMRPPMGAGALHQPQTKGSGMGFIMPIYTIGIIIFFAYTIMKIVFKKPLPNAPYGPAPTDPNFRKEVFGLEGRHVEDLNGSTLGSPYIATSKNTSAINPCPTSTITTSTTKPKSSTNAIENASIPIINNQNQNQNQKQNHNQHDYDQEQQHHHLYHNNHHHYENQNQNLNQHQHHNQHPIDMRNEFYNASLSAATAATNLSASLRQHQQQYQQHQQQQQQLEEQQQRELDELRKSSELDVTLTRAMSKVFIKDADQIMEIETLRKKLEDTERAMAKLIAEMTANEFQVKKPNANSTSNNIETISNGHTNKEHKSDEEDSKTANIAGKSDDKFDKTEIRDQNDQQRKKLEHTFETQSRKRRDGSADRSVAVLGMEVTASCEGGQKWSGRPPTPDLFFHNEHSKEINGDYNMPTPQSIYLEGALAHESKILVSDAETRREEVYDYELNGSPEEPAVVLSSKMTLSLINLDTSLDKTDSDEDIEGKRNSKDIESPLADDIEIIGHINENEDETK